MSKIMFHEQSTTYLTSTSALRLVLFNQFSTLCVSLSLSLRRDKNLPLCVAPLYHHMQQPKPTLKNPINFAG